MFLSIFFAALYTAFCPSKEVGSEMSQELVKVTALGHVCTGMRFWMQGLSLLFVFCMFFVVRRLLHLLAEHHVSDTGKSSH